jgi:hypothetical protein
LSRVFAGACAVLLSLWSVHPQARATEEPPGAAATDNNAGLDELMRLLAERKHGHVTFTEVHTLNVLQRPLHSSGELVFEAPDRLEKRTLKPQAEDLLLSGELLTIHRGGHTRTLDLTRHADIAPWIESIRATLTGDRAALERYFQVDYSGELSHWTLLLVPHKAAQDIAIAQVRIEGSGATVHQLEIRQNDGDRSVMTIGPELSP